MELYREAVEKVTEKWMELAAGNKEWKDARYPLAVLMVREKMSPWGASVEFAKVDPKKRKVMSLFRIAKDVMELIVQSFGEEKGADVIGGFIDQLWREGTCTIPVIYWPRMRDALDFPVSREKAYILHKETTGAGDSTPTTP